MARNHHLFRSIAYSALIILVSRLLSLSGVSIGHIVGSSFAHFSFASALIPLAGLAGGTLTCVLTSLLSLVVSGGGYGIGKLLAYHIPGFFGGVSLVKHYAFFTHLMVPLLAVMLFAVHPVGGSAMLYTTYWLVPALVYFFGQRSIYCRMLAATFVAHAVGSVIWLYTVPMAATQWLALVPVIPYERMVIAGGMMGVYYGACASVCATKWLWSWCVAYHRSVISVR